MLVYVLTKYPSSNKTETSTSLTVRKVCVKSLVMREVGFRSLEPSCLNDILASRYDAP